MLHQTLLPRHARWNGFFRRLRYVIVDECHTYRGVFGSHVAQVLRRLHRVAAHHGDLAPASPGRGPVFILLASATVSEPAACARLLTGRHAEAVTENAAPRGPVTFGLWEPPLTARAARRARRSGAAPPPRPPGCSPTWWPRRSPRWPSPGPGAAPRRSRRARGGRCARRARPAWRHRVAAYRSGYLPEDRRALEEALRTGADHRPGHHDRAGAGRGHQRPGRRADRRLAGHPGRAVAAGRAGRAGPAAARSRC